MQSAHDHYIMCHDVDHNGDIRVRDLMGRGAIHDTMVLMVH